MTGFISLGSKITMDVESSHEIKRLLLLGNKVMTNLDSIFIKKQRDHFADKSQCGQSSGFSSRHVWIKSRTIKKAELQRTDTFKWWCCRRFLRVPWTSRRSNQSILKVINPEYSLEGLMLKLQFFGYLMQKLTHWKRPWCWERLKTKEEGGNRRWDV